MKPSAAAFYIRITPRGRSLLRFHCILQSFYKEARNFFTCLRFFKITAWA